MCHWPINIKGLLFYFHFIEKTPDCQLLEDQYDAKGEYPNCCPIYECPEGIEITYKNKAGSNKKSPRTLE